MAKAAHAVGRYIQRGLAVVGFGTVSAGALAAVAASKKNNLPEGFVLDLDLESGMLVEVAEKNPIKKAFDKSKQGQVALRDVLRAIEHAGGDERVRAVTCRLDGDKVGGLAQIQELRDAVLRFRLATAGRVPTVAHASSYGVAGNGTSQLYLASAFQHVSMQPEGWVNFVGVSYQPWFFRGLFDKWKITPLFVTRREYKNAANSITQTGFTDPHRKASCDMVFAIGDQIVKGVAEARGLPEKEVRRLMDQAPLSCQDAVGAGLITAAKHQDEVDAMVARAAAGPRAPGDAAPPDLDGADDGGKPAKKPKRIGIQKYIAAMEAEEKKKAGGGFMSAVTDAYEAATAGDDAGEAAGEPVTLPDNPEVAVIYAAGAITAGKSEDSPTGATLGSRTLCSLIRKAREDKDVRAVVLRIDSPGGSALASATIHREVELLRDAGKFVVASMGNVAASGGYYIAAPASVIVAQPGTLTGSIGVIFGKLDIQNFLKDLGVTTETVAVGRNSTALSGVGGFTRSQEKKVNQIVDATYEEFKGVVARGRGLKPKYVESVAKGRVWMGEKAKEIGLVDSLGGIEDAVRLAQAHVAEEQAAGKLKEAGGGDAGHVVDDASKIKVKVISDDRQGLRAMVQAALGKSDDEGTAAAVAIALASSLLPPRLSSEVQTLSQGVPAAMAAAAAVGAGGAAVAMGATSGAVAGRAAGGAAAAPYAWGWGAGPGVQAWSEAAASASAAM